MILPFTIIFSISFLSAFTCFCCLGKALECSYVILAIYGRPATELASWISEARQNQGVAALFVSESCSALANVWH